MLEACSLAAPNWQAWLNDIKAKEYPPMLQSLASLLTLCESHHDQDGSMFHVGALDSLASRICASSPLDRGNSLLCDFLLDNCETLK